MDFQVVQLAYCFFLSEKRIVDHPPTPRSRCKGTSHPVTQSTSHLTLGLLSAEVPGKATNGGTRGSGMVYRSYTAFLDEQQMEKEVVQLCYCRSGFPR